MWVCLLVCVGEYCCGCLHCDLGLLRFVYFGFALIIGCVGEFTLIVICHLVDWLLCCLLILDFINSVDVIDSCLSVLV